MTDFGADDSASEVAIQADGKIVAAGSSDPGRSYPNFALARYNPSGSLDPTFDGDGRVVTDFGGTGETAYAIAIQADGKIVAAGTRFSGTDNFVLARYNPTGSLDPTFDGDGWVLTDFGGWNDNLTGVAIQADQKIVAAGFSNFDANPDRFALARYNPNGSLDPTFDSDGRVWTRFGAFDFAFGVAIQADGRIVAAGHSNAGAGRFPNDFALARYKPDGSLDPTFHGDSRVLTDFGHQEGANSVAIQADQKIVAAGGRGYSSDFALARYNPNGRLDPTFDGDGRVVTGFAARALDDASEVAIQADGRIVAAGFTEAGPNPSNFALARYLTFFCDGVPATIVGTAGNDNLTGTAGNDVIVALGGFDAISGLGGNDKICGGAGDDSLDGGGDADTLYGGPGIDTATYATRTSGVAVDIDSVADDGNAADGPTGARDNVKTDIENLIGGKGADALRGRAAANRLTGGLGADFLRGLGGNDVLFANDGTTDAEIDCDGGAADAAHVDATDPSTVGCETIGP